MLLTRWPRIQGIRYVNSKALVLTCNCTCESTYPRVGVIQYHKIDCEADRDTDRLDCICLHEENRLTSRNDEGML